MSFFCSRIPHGITSHVSLVSFDLGQFPSLPRFLMTITVLESAGQVFCSSMSLSLGVSDASLWLWGKRFETTNSSGSDSPSFAQISGFPLPPAYAPVPMVTGHLFSLQDMCKAATESVPCSPSPLPGEIRRGASSGESHAFRPPFLRQWRGHTWSSQRWKQRHPRLSSLR